MWIKHIAITFLFFFSQTLEASNKQINVSHHNFQTISHMSDPSLLCEKQKRGVIEYTQKFINKEPENHGFYFEVQGDIHKKEKISWDEFAQSIKEISPQNILEITENRWKKILLYFQETKYIDKSSKKDLFYTLPKIIKNASFKGFEDNDALLLLPKSYDVNETPILTNVRHVRFMHKELLSALGMSKKKRFFQKKRK